MMLQKINKAIDLTKGNYFAAIEEFGDVKQLLVDLAKSYEYYTAVNKPKSMWDEYDHLMCPIWLRLQEILKDE